ncbi:MAG: hypothetical protein KAX65_09995 [Caldilineaceae bacterium]|nr:hypothetical protein [Caldilineaceae bacterium]
MPLHGYAKTIENRLIKESFNKAIKVSPQTSQRQALPTDLARKDKTMYKSFSSPASSAKTRSAHDVPSTAPAWRAARFQEPDWSVLREADFSGTLVEWSGTIVARLGDDMSQGAALDLERALAFAG